MTRIVRITDQGLLHEPDPRHVELLTRDLGLSEGDSHSGGFGTEGKARRGVAKPEIHGLGRVARRSGRDAAGGELRLGGRARAARRCVAERVLKSIKFNIFLINQQTRR